MRTILRAALFAGLVHGLFAQTEKFEFADVRVSPKTSNPFLRVPPPSKGRAEWRSATMVDLIRLAWGFDADKILEGPSWLEMSRFDVIAKVAPDVTPETLKPMLQSLLADRFQLKVRQIMRPLPTFALTAGTKPQLKEADGTGKSGCEPQTGNPGPGFTTLSTSNNGVVTRYVMGPGMVIEYSCRNMTMESFAAGLRQMFGVSAGNNPILDETGLKGAWNFDLRFSLQLAGLFMNNDTGERIPLATAVEKQLGLKLVPRDVPTPVIVVDSVNEKPSENPPGTDAALPPVMQPTEFEIADVKKTDLSQPMNMSLNIPVGGRFIATGLPMRILLSEAFRTATNYGQSQLVGIPEWAATERYDINAKGPASLGAARLDNDVYPGMLRKLLEERFGLKTHLENRPDTVYSLVAAKPKLKKADPTSRTSCKTMPAPAGSPPGTRVISCQNATVAQFAERLLGVSPEVTWSVVDATEISGSYDFTVSWQQANLARLLAPGAAGGGRGGGGPGDGELAAAAPTGGVTIFEALEKQLGLKLEAQKRPMPVIVIDHLDQKPTDN